MTASSALPPRVSHTDTRMLPGSLAPGPAAAAEVLSWGANDAFQLGYGSRSGRDVPGPTQLPQRAALAQVAAGYSSGLVLATSGLVWAWGANTYGQLGNNSTDWSDRAVPVQLSLSEGDTVTAIAAGAGHSMALTANGDVFVWGSNQYGQLGIGAPNVDKKLVPVQVIIPWSQLGLPEDTTITAVAAGAAHCLALTSTQQVLAWGYNSKGQLGNNDTQLANQFSPVLVQLPNQVKVSAIAGGRDHSLAITTTNGALAWGSNFRGQLGDPQPGSQSVVPVPVRLPSGTVVATIAAGLYHSLARTTDGNVFSWGDNQAGQLGAPGVGDHSDVPVPATLPDGVTVEGIAAGGMHSLAVTSTAAVLGWGANEAGQLGDGSTENRTSPVWVELAPGVNAHAVGAGSYFSVALVSRGPKLAWGSNSSGQLGNDDSDHKDQLKAVDVHLPEDVVLTDIAAGYKHSLAATEMGVVLTWGSNEFGQLGIGPNDPGDRDSPAEAILSEQAAAVAAGAAHSLALTTDGDIYAWGRNNNGQLGLGPDAGPTEPEPIKIPLDWLPAGAHVVAIAAYNLSSFALLSNGQVFGWGNNGYGQLGVNDKQNRDTPTKMLLPEGVTATAIAAGGTHSLVVTNHDTVLGSGYNYFGQLGTGDNQERLKPDTALVVPDGVTGISMVAAGIYHSLAICTKGKALGFGQDYYGELGDDRDRTTSNKAVYVQLDTVQLHLPSDTTFAAIACGGTHSLAVTDGGVLLAWGNNGDGQLGDTTRRPRKTPVRSSVPPGTTNTAVAGGLYHSLAR